MFARSCKLLAHLLASARGHLDYLSQLNKIKSRPTSPCARFIATVQSIGVLSCFVHAPFRTFHVQRFSYATFRLRKSSVAVWRGSEGIGVFLFCHVETPGSQWTGAQFGGVSLVHARTRKQWKHAHLFKGCIRKAMDRCTFSKARVGVFYRAP